jgi:predicted nucleotidyltransferase
MSNSWRGSFESAEGFSQGAARPIYCAAMSQAFLSDDALLARLVAVLANVGGVAAIVPGGSRARGAAHDASDYDIGQVLFALNGQYLINEKGALAVAADFPVTVDGLTARVADIWRLIGTEQHGAAMRLLRSLERDLRELSADS